MFRSISLFLKRPIDARSHVDPDDVAVVKRSLERLGYYGRPKWGLRGFTDNGLFEGIKRFQRDHGLTVDGIIKPGGETATEMGSLLPKPHPEDEEALQDRKPGTPDSDRDCDRRLSIDTAVCDYLYRTKGKRVYAICMSTANARYAACLTGTPIYALPPLFQGDPD